jgi:magnesium transporter
MYDFPSATAAQVRITCANYSPDCVSMREIDDLENFLGHHRPEWSVVRWINVDGLSCG